MISKAMVILINLMNFIILYIQTTQFMQQEETNQFKVAPIISDQKQKQFIQQIIQTVLGISNQIKQSHLTIAWAIALPLITYLIPLLVNSIYAAIIIPSVINVVINLIIGIVRKGEGTTIGQIAVRNITLAIYSVLWTHHIFVISQDHQSQPYLFVLSAVSILTSIETIALASVKEFGGHSVQNNTLGADSTAFMRAFIAFPTLIAEICVYNAENTAMWSPYTYPLRLANSIMFVVWWLGWFSSIKNTIYFILNKITMIILGDESQYNWQNAFKSIIINMIPIAIYEGVYHSTSVSSLNPLIIGATVTSIITFIKNSIVHKRVNRASYTRSIIVITIDVLVCIMLVLLYHLANLKNVSLSIFLGIDIGVYFGFNILKEMGKGWSRFGINIHCKILNYNAMLIIQRMLLRVFSGLSVLLILTNYIGDIISLFNYQSNIIGYIIIPFLGYRSFKRCISQTNSFSLHLSLLICLIAINAGNVASGCLVVLMMPPFPPSPYLAIASIFQIPPKAYHQNQCFYQIFYIFATVIGLCLHFLSLGTFQLTMIFGLPMYFPCFPTQTQGYQVKSAQNSLYQKILQNIDSSIFRFYQPGYYLLRIQKYILLMEVKSGCYGYCELLDFRGLEVQEVTSCHSKEGQTIDRMVEETWGDNKQNCSISPLFIAVSPFMNEKIYVPTQNDIQLTGVIESKQFVTLFKQTALKSIIRQYSKMTLTENQKKQAEVIIGQMSAFYKKDQAQNIFPFDFVKKHNIGASYPVTSGKIKLPPISKKGGKKTEVVNDFLDLLQSSHEPQEPSLTGLIQKQKQTLSQSKKQGKIDQMNMAIILTLYYYSVGKLDYIMVQKLYKIIKRQTETITQVDFDNFEKFLSIALGAAFKISIDKYINGQFQVQLQDFEQYEKNSFLGTSDSEQFKNAILNDRQDIWTINYSKRTLAIKRMARSQTNMYIFNVNQPILKSVWNNLRFQLVYATNDNDERYSIQTHPTLLRNLWVEACEQPFGYPSYHSGLMMSQ